MSIEIRRETDDRLINRISEMPEVRPFICYHDRPIDWRPSVSGCAILSNGTDAVAIFEQTEDRVWESHTLFAPSCRGRRAVETGKAMVAYMIPQLADVLWGVTPLRNKAARWFNRQIGAIPIGRAVCEPEGEVEIFMIGSAA